MSCFSSLVLGRLPLHIHAPIVNPSFQKAYLLLDTPQLDSVFRKLLDVPREGIPVAVTRDHSYPAVPKEDRQASQVASMSPLATAGFQLVGWPYSFLLVATPRPTEIHHLSMPSLHATCCCTSCDSFYRNLPIGWTVGGKTRRQAGRPCGKLICLCRPQCTPPSPQTVSPTVPMSRTSAVSHGPSYGVASFFQRVILCLAFMPYHILLAKDHLMGNKTLIFPFSGGLSTRTGSSCKYRKFMRKALSHARGEAVLQNDGIRNIPACLCIDVRRVRDYIPCVSSSDWD